MNQEKNVTTDSENTVDVLNKVIEEWEELRKLFDGCVDREVSEMVNKRIDSLNDVMERAGLK